MGSNLYIAHYLSRQSHNEKKDKEIESLRLNIDIISITTGIPSYICIHDIQEATQNDIHYPTLRIHHQRLTIKHR